jgi:general secretion pathway protein D
VVRVGEFARPQGSVRNNWRGLVSCILATLITSCTSSLLTQDDKHEPDLLDTVHALDLLPRSPQKVSSNDRASGDPAAKPSVFSGSEVAAITPPRPQPAGSSDGFELNFENTPVATVAKVVLGDILGTGYTIDPRVQGSVSLASVRPVPKSDLIFVLETALRTSGVVLVRDSAGYRLIPVTDAAGAGNIDSAAARAEPGYGISVVPLQYVSASTLIKLLDSFAIRAAAQSGKRPSKRRSASMWIG